MKLMQTRRDFLRMAGKALLGSAAATTLPVLYTTDAQAAGANMATAGIICGAIGIALWIIMLILGFSFMPF